MKREKNGKKPTIAINIVVILRVIMLGGWLCAYRGSIIDFASHRLRQRPICAFGNLTRR